MIDAVSAAAVRRARSALSLVDSTADPEYSIAAILRAKIADTWARVPSIEHDKHRNLVATYGECQSQHTVRLPDDALLTQRDMTVAGVSGSQFLVGVSAPVPYVEALRASSVALRLGAQSIDCGRENAAIPKGATPATVSWLGDEGAAIPETQPVIGQLASAPKILGALVDISHQALRQSNSEAVVRRELLLAAGAELDRVALCGTGAAGQPTGITATANIGTFTGASLNYAQALNATEDVAANATDASLGWTCPPAIATLLAQRVRLAATQPFLLDGDSIGGLMLGRPLLSTAGCPAATLIFGNWSSLWILGWGGGASLQVDPYSFFTSGICRVRLLLCVDIALPHPAHFSVGSSVT